MKAIRLAGLALVALALGGCSFQFAIGRDIYQNVEISPLGGVIGVILAFVAFMLALAFAASSGGGMGPGPRQ